MNTNPNGQRGMTLIGWLIVLALIGFFTLCILRIGPGYLEYYKVVQVLKSLQAERGVADMNVMDIRRILSKRFDVNDIRTITPRQVRLQKNGPGWVVSVDYDFRTPLIANLSVVAHFERSLALPAR